MGVRAMRWDNFTEVHSTLLRALVASLNPSLRFAQLRVQNEATCAQSKVLCTLR